MKKNFILFFIFHKNKIYIFYNILLSNKKKTSETFASKFHIKTQIKYKNNNYLKTAQASTKYLKQSKIHTGVVVVGVVVGGRPQGSGYSQGKIL